MNKLFVFFCALFLICCTPQQRIKRLLKKHPELVHKLDTTIIDTFITRSFYYDTTLKANFFKDTIFISKNNIETKFFYNYSTDSLYINNFVKPDTLIKTITIQGKTIEKPNSLEGLKYLFYFSIVVLLIIGLLKATKRK